MSSANIARRILTVCDQFELKQITLPELQMTVEGHAAALEGLSQEQRDQILEFFNRLEEIEFKVQLKDQESLAQKVVEDMRSFFSRWAQGVEE